MTTPPDERIQALDVLRGFALCGIVLINIYQTLGMRELPTGLAKVVSVPLHVIVDFAVAGLLIAAPFLFGFSDEGAPTAFFIVLGVAHLLLTIGTRFLPAERAAR